MARWHGGTTKELGGAVRDGPQQLSAGLLLTNLVTARVFFADTGMDNEMGNSGSGRGAVVAIRPRHRAQGMCSCGWTGRPRMLLSSAKVDALVHAARHGCGVAIPLIQPDTVYAVNPPGALNVRCPAGCGASFSVPIVITDSLSATSADGEPCVRFTADAPELHDYVNQHLQTCPSATSRVDLTLERARS